MRMKTIAFTLIFLFMSASTYSLFTGNGTCEAFPEQCATNSSSGGKFAWVYNTVSDYIREGAINFLRAKSEWSNYLEELEAVNVIQSNSMHLEYTISYLEIAQTTYFQLTYFVSSLPYNQEFIEKLKAIDYKGFQENKLLIRSVFEEVQEYLKNGDIKGIYNEFKIRTSNILESLYNLRNSEKISIHDIFRINQRLCEFSLFGQYVSEVVYSL